MYEDVFGTDDDDFVILLLLSLNDEVVVGVLNKEEKLIRLDDEVDDDKVKDGVEESDELNDRDRKGNGGRTEGDDEAVRGTLLFRLLLGRFILSVVLSVIMLLLVMFMCCFSSCIVGGAVLDDVDGGD